MSCEHCHHTRPIMYPMQGTPAWELCSKCWKEGVQSMRADAMPVNLRAPNPSPAKEDVGSFERGHSAKGARYVPDGESFW